MELIVSEFMYLIRVHRSVMWVLFFAFEALKYSSTIDRCRLGKEKTNLFVTSRYGLTDLEMDRLHPVIGLRDDGSEVVG